LHEATSDDDRHIIRTETTGRARFRRAANRRELAEGFYFYSDLVERGIIKDRNDQKRKQERYRFPRPTKTGDRQAPISKARVHRWLRYRDALTRRSQN
jgi:hypothetical protein